MKTPPNSICSKHMKKADPNCELCKLTYPPQDSETLEDVVYPFLSGGSKTLSENEVEKLCRAIKAYEKRKIEECFEGNYKRGVISVEIILKSLGIE